MVTKNSQRDGQASDGGADVSLKTGLSPSMRFEPT